MSRHATSASARRLKRPTSTTRLETAAAGGTGAGARTYDVDVLPLYGLGPEESIQSGGAQPELHVMMFPGMGRITDFTNDLTSLVQGLPLQISESAPSRGLQMGLAFHAVER